MGEFAEVPTLHWLEMFAMAPVNYDAPLAVELKLIAGLTVKSAEPLARYTSMKIGGPADWRAVIGLGAAIRGYPGGKPQTRVYAAALFASACSVPLSEAGRVRMSSQASGGCGGCA